MDIDKTSTPAPAGKPVTVIPNYSLYTSNLFACRIPIGPNDPYSPNDHWQWTATQWRGIIGPDLTIYVRDTPATESATQSVEITAPEGRPDVGLIIVRRAKADTDGEQGADIEASVLRRLGFEVSEWVRAFCAGNGKE